MHPECPGYTPEQEDVQVLSALAPRGELQLLGSSPSCFTVVYTAQYLRDCEESVRVSMNAEKCHSFQASTWIDLGIYSRNVQGSMLQQNSCSVPDSDYQLVFFLCVSRSIATMEMYQ